jgi:hypothetical protein
VSANNTARLTPQPKSITAKNAKHTKRSHSFSAFFAFFAVKIRARRQNSLELTPAYDLQIPNADFPGAAFEGGRIEHANIAGNKLVAGEHGARWQTDAISGLVLKNDFAAASLRALAYTGTNGSIGPAFRFTILRNSLGQGAQFHLKGPVKDPGIFFSSENTFKDGVITVNPFINPSSSPIHTRYQP